MKHLFKVLVLFFAAAVSFSVNVFADEGVPEKFKNFENKGEITILNNGIIKVKIPEQYRDGEIKTYFDYGRGPVGEYFGNIMKADGTCIIPTDSAGFDFYKGKKRKLIIDYGKDGKGAIYDLSWNYGINIDFVKSNYEFDICQKGVYHYGGSEYYLKDVPGSISAALVRRNDDGNTEYLGIHDVERIIYGGEKEVIIERIIDGKSYVVVIDIATLNEIKIEMDETIILGTRPGEVYFIQIKDKAHGDFMKLVRKGGYKKKTIHGGILYNTEKSVRENFESSEALQEYLKSDDLITSNEDKIRALDIEIKKKLKIEDEAPMELVSEGYSIKKGVLEKAPNFMGYDMTYSYYHDGEVYLLREDDSVTLCQVEPCKIIRRNNETGEEVVAKEDVIFVKPQNMKYGNVSRLIEDIFKTGNVRSKTFKDEGHEEVREYIKEEIMKSKGEGLRLVSIDSKVSFSVISYDINDFIKELKEQNGVGENLRIDFGGHVKEDDLNRDYIYMVINWKK